MPRQSIVEAAQKHGAVAESGERVKQTAFAIGSRALQLRMNARVDHGQVYGLRHEIVDALTESVDDGGAIFFGSHHDDRKLAGGISSAQQAQQVQAAHARHDLIEQDQIVMSLVDLVERLLAAFRDFNLITAVSQAVQEQIAIFGVVVNHQQLTGIRSHSPLFHASVLFERHRCRCVVLFDRTRRTLTLKF